MGGLAALPHSYGWELLAQPLKTPQIRGLRNNIYTYLQKEIAVVARVMLSDYIYSDTVSQVAFFKIPHQLIDDPKFKQLSIAAKLLYGLLLDRMSLSAQNGWHDNTGRVYIYYTVNDVCQDIGCGRNKAMRLLAELDTVKGIGLIERKKQGQGRPDKIFVKRITVQENAENAPETEQVPTTPVSEVDFSDVHRSENPTSRGRKNRRLEVSKANPNKTDENQTNFIQTNLSIYPHTTTKLGWIDRYEQKEKMNISEKQQATAASMLCCPVPFWTTSLCVNWRRPFPFPIPKCWSAVRHSYPFTWCLFLLPLLYSYPIQQERILSGWPYAGPSQTLIYVSVC